MTPIRLILATLTVLVGGSALAENGSLGGTVSGTPRLRRDAIVYVVGAPATTSTATAIYDQKGMVFVPRVLPVVRGTTVKFLNSDMVRHNVFSPDFEKYNLGTWPVGESRTYVFDKCKDELCAYTQLCNVHTEMEGFVVVLQSPHFALVKADGSFSLDLPAGTWTLKLWSPKKASAPPQTVTIKPGEKATVAFAVGG